MPRRTPAPSSLLTQDRQVHHLVELLRMSVRAGDDEGLLSALAALNAHVRAARKR